MEWVTEQGCFRSDECGTRLMDRRMDVGSTCPRLGNTSAGKTN